ncbi:MAG: hypothetical protein SFT92_01910 [Rickettsiales bacterium]|nr:hypothetical protein [Rickettsiales bacterium]
MRPLPDLSSDLIYSDHFDRADLIDIGEALGVSDIRYITTATLRPDRVLYHACLNGIQTYVRIDALDEAERSRIIADMADKMYAHISVSYQEMVRIAQPMLDEKRNQTDQFCHDIQQSQEGKPWDKERFQAEWPLKSDYYRWQKKAIESYATIQERIHSGQYVPKEGQDASTLTEYWSHRNLEYKHYRDIARSLVEEYIDHHIPIKQRLSMNHPKGREVVLIAGGMGSGKSELTSHYLNSLPPETRTDRVLHNADYLKYAVYRSAIEDGGLPSDTSYQGPEVQGESSNALYEGTRKRTYLAGRFDVAPNVVVNSIVLGSFEVQEGLTGGGSVVAHHIAMRPEAAVEESEKRRAAGGRAPSVNDVTWSALASARSLLLLTEPEYHHKPVTVNLYHRAAGKPPVSYGIIDAKHAEIRVHDVSGLAELSQIAFPKMSELDALKEYLSRFQAAGFSLVITKDAALEQPIATLDSQQKLTILSPGAFEDVAQKKWLRDIATQTQLGGNIQLPLTNALREGPYA